MNPSAEGTVYPDVPFTVDPARVAAFRAVFGITEGVPPTFVTAAEFSVYPHVIGDPNLGLDFTRVLHGSQEYVYERPLREGETLSVRARIDSIRQKGDTGFLTVVMELRDDDGELVCTARSQMVERGM
ncbi:MAG TPA: MaoC family dehydratase N-terminal domain-containing protein [Actinomycetota bacterium]|jgi:acyl dehydratase|nr:MaoC family dehydratase N-terminal domain-containing protein [Actinomycetota bacterium]